MLSFLRKYLAVFVFVTVFFSSAYQANAIGWFAIPPALSAAGTVGSAVMKWGGLAFGVAKVGAAAACAVNLESCVGFLLNYIAYYILYVLNMLATFLVWLTGWVLNYTFYYTVAQFTTTFTEFVSGRSGEEGNLIYYAWSIVRDVLNAGVFFVVIYHAIRAMFQGFDDIKKKFIALLVFVVLVNFSLLFVKLVADISNIAMLQLYNAVAQPKGSDTRENFTTHRVDGLDTGLSTFVISSINPTTAISQARSQQYIKENIEQNTKTFSFQFALLLMNLYLVVIFIYISAILFTRAVTFIVVMIASPLLVAGMFFSGLEDVNKKIKAELFEEAFQGPGIIFFLILSAMIASKLFGTETFSNTKFAEGAGFFAVNLPMFLKVFVFGTFNYFAFSFMRDLTTRGNNFSEKFMGLALAGGLGAGAWGLRKTVGGLANSFYNNEQLGGKWRKDLQSDNASVRAAAMRKLKVASFFRNRTYDVRAGMDMLNKTALGAKVLTGIKTGIPLNIDIGKAGKNSEASYQALRDKKAYEKREAWKKEIMEAGGNDISTMNQDLINSGLVKIKTIDDDGKEIEKGAEEVISQRNALEKEIRTYNADEKEIKASEALLAEWSRTKSDRDTVQYNGSSRVLGDVKAEVERQRSEHESKTEDLRKRSEKTFAEMEKVNDILNDENKKTDLMEKYGKKQKKITGKRFDELQGSGEIKYFTELHRRMAARSYAKMTGETPITSMARANKKYRDAHEKTQKPDNETRQRLSSMISNARDITRLINTSNIFSDGEKLSLKDQISKVTDIAQNGNKYSKVGSKETLDDDIRNKILESMDILVDAIDNKGLSVKFDKDTNNEFRNIKRDHRSNYEKWLTADAKAAEEGKSKDGAKKDSGDSSKTEKK